MYFSIFDRAQKSIDYTDEVRKVNEGLLIEFPAPFQVMGPISLYKDLESALQQWPHRGSAITLIELLNNYDLQNIVAMLNGERVRKAISLNEYLTYMDILLNLINFCSTHRLGSLLGTANKMKEHITRCLTYVNYEPKYLLSDKVLLVEMGASLPNLSAERQPPIEEHILIYANKITKGDIRRKRDILTALANEYEPLLKQKLHETLPQFSDKLRHAVNKLDIRHNNHEGKGQNQYLTSISDEEYEKLLDDIYNCLLTLHWCADAKPGFMRICEALSNLEAMEKQRND